MYYNCKEVSEEQTEAAGETPSFTRGKCLSAIPVFPADILVLSWRKRCLTGTR